MTRETTTQTAREEATILVRAYILACQQGRDSDIRSAILAGYANAYARLTAWQQVVERVRWWWFARRYPTRAAAIEAAFPQPSPQGGAAE
jgi:hypothetical protein